MIADNIKTMSCYEGLSDSFKKAFDFLKREDLHDLPVGSYEIDRSEELLQKFRNMIQRLRKNL